MKKKYVIFVLLICILASSCSFSHADQETQVREKITENSSYTENKGIASEIPQALLNYSFENVNLETDMQTCFAGIEPMVETYKGYYYINSDKFLCFLDKESLQNVFVCSNINCLHDTEDCDACMKEYRIDEGLWYYDGYLYGVKYDKITLEFALYRMTQDRSQEEKVARLFDYSSEDGTVQVEITLHKGIIFYAIWNGENYSLRSRSLKNIEEETVIYEVSGVDGQIFRLRGYDDILCYETGYYSDDTREEYIGSLYGYEISTGKIYKIYDGVYQDYLIADGCLIYGTPATVRKVDLYTGEDVLLMDTGYPHYFSYDGTYLYVDNSIQILLGMKSKEEQCLLVLDLNGTVAGEIHYTGGYQGPYGDDEYLFVYMVTETEKQGVIQQQTHLKYRSKKELWAESAWKDLIW